MILSPSNTPELPIGYISSEAIAKCFIVLLLPTLEKFIIEFESAPPLRGRILLPQATVTQYFQISFLFKGILVAQFGCLQRTNRTRTRSFDFRVAQSCHKLSNLIDHSVGPKLTPFRHEEIRFFLKLGCLLRVSSHKTWLLSPIKGLIGKFLTWPRCSLHSGSPMWYLKLKATPEGSQLQGTDNIE